MIEEKTLWQEISALENRYESWAQALPITIPVNTKTTTKPQPVSSARNAMASMPPEVAAFEVSYHVQLILCLVNILSLFASYVMGSIGHIQIYSAFCSVSGN